MNEVTGQIEELLREIGNRKDDIDWLSNCCMKLASLLYLHSSLMADAELEEARTLIGLIDASLGTESKRMPVAEAERRAIVSTGNNYERLKTQGEAVTETIMSIKKRLDVLNKEYQRG